MSILETNIRIVAAGRKLRLAVRKVWVEGTSLSEDVLEKACGTLRYRRRLAAKPIFGDQPYLLVATDREVPEMPLEGDDWVLNLKDSGDATAELDLSTSEGQRLIPILLERALLSEIAGTTEFWTLDSPRIWYQPKPFLSKDGIDVYRRFEVSSELIEDEGVGLVVDVGTAFFSSDSLAYFFDPELDPKVARERSRRFQELTGRQQGQKGTLLYDTGRARRKCYFVDAPEGATCGRTPPIKVRGKTYDSLLAYYKETNAELNVVADTPAVLVSFPNIERPQWAAANRLLVRVMNDDLPRSLRSADKIVPSRRRQLVHEFWELLGPKPVGRLAPGLKEGFWRPEKQQARQLEMPTLEFGGSRILRPPNTVSADAYRSHFHKRSELLGDSGCYSLPPTTPRTLFYAYPSYVDEGAAKQLAEDVTALIRRWTGKPFQVQPVCYATVTEAATSIRRTGPPATVLFVLDREPISYFDCSFQLPDWRIKRVTDASLSEHYTYLQDGAWDKRARNITYQEGQKKWDSYVAMNAYDVLQQMDAVPWKLGDLGGFEGALAIDVGRDRSHWALSLLVARGPYKSPDFLFRTRVERKPDSKQEAINPRLLKDLTIQLFQQVFGRRADALSALLVLRDGQFVGREQVGVDNAIAALKELGLLEPEARIRLAELHKATLKNIRLWEVDERNNVDNPLEGTCVRLSSGKCVVATTGRATLHQGTAEPLLLADSNGGNMWELGQMIFAACQLNWSSPAAAQRLPLMFKRTDEELQNRVAQEIRRTA